jgi:hypothetical protein
MDLVVLVAVFFALLTLVAVAALAVEYRNRLRESEHRLESLERRAGALTARAQHLELEAENVHREAGLKADVKDVERRIDGLIELLKHRK